MTEHITPYRQKSISQFVLASSSPRRKELVATLNLSLPVSIFSVETDEHIEASWTPTEAVEKLSISKAQAVCSALHSGQAPSNISSEQSLILAADTVVVLENDILGKPSSMEDAVSTLMRLQGKTHQVMTGVTLLHSGTGEKVVRHRITDVVMRSLSESFIRKYVSTGESMDKAGSYGIQGKGALLVDEIHGCYFNVVGLPISMVSEMLEHFNVKVLY